MAPPKVVSACGNVSRRAPPREPRQPGRRVTRPGKCRPPRQKMRLNTKSRPCGFHRHPTTKLTSSSSTSKTTSRPATWCWPRRRVSTRSSYSSATPPRVWRPTRARPVTSTHWRYLPVNAVIRYPKSASPPFAPPTCPSRWVFSPGIPSAPISCRYGAPRYMTGIPGRALSLSKPACGCAHVITRKCRATR